MNIYMLKDNIHSAEAKTNLDILMNMKVIPCRWDHTIPYGIFYRTTPRQDVETFLAFVRETYDRNNPGEIIPVL